MKVIFALEDFSALFSDSVSLFISTAAYHNKHGPISAKIKIQMIDYVATRVGGN